MSDFNKEQADPRLRAFDAGRMVPEFNDILCLLIFTTLNFRVILFVACDIKFVHKMHSLKDIFKRHSI